MCIIILYRNSKSLLRLLCRHNITTDLKCSLTALAEESARYSELTLLQNGELHKTSQHLSNYTLHILIVGI